MRETFYFLLLGAIVLGVLCYTCTSPQREAYEKIDAALDESERYADNVSGIAEQIVEICIDYEEEDSIPLDSIRWLAGQIEDESNGAISILEEAKSDLFQEVYNNEY